MTGLARRIDDQTWTCIALIAVLSALSVAFAEAYTITVMVSLLIWIYLCVSWNIIGGLVGQVSFGQAAFFGIGGYATLYLATVLNISPWFGMFAAAFIAAAAAYVVGYLPFRKGLSPLIFALLTLAFAYILEFGVGGIRALGGTNGLYAKAVGETFWDFRFDDPANFLIVMAVMLCVLMAVVSLIYGSRRGFFWRAVHDNEAAAAAMGVNPFVIKQEAFALSAFATALAGGFNAQFIGFIDPPSMFGIEITIYILLFTVVGGAGSLLGPVLGPLILFPIGEVLRIYLQDHGGGALHHMVYGVALVVVILLLPGGIVSGLARFGLTRGRLRIPDATGGKATTSPDVRSANSGAPILAVQGVSKVFGGLIAVNNVSFDVRRGEIFGVIGPNGAGKTTLFSMLGGFARPSSGKIMFDGQEIQSLAPYDVSHLGVARTFQIVQAFQSLTVREVVVAAALVQYRGADATVLADGIIERMSLAAKRDAACADLTLAEQRRLVIARALATKPKLILLDEILGGLTPREADEAIKGVRAIRDEGVTVLIIEHMVRAVMSLCDRIAVLDAGEKISLGTPGEVGNDPRVIEAYLGNVA